MEPNAEKIGLKNLKVLEPKENSLIKLVTFVPDAQADSVREVLFAAGCGNIGNYDSCSYSLKGEGTFRAKPLNRVLTTLVTSARTNSFG